MKTISRLVLIASASFALACSGSHSGDYLKNQTIYEGIIGSPVYVEEISSLGGNTVHLTYDNKNRCIGWKKVGGSYDNVEVSIEYDGENISKIIHLYSFPGEDFQRTQEVVVNTPDSTVMFCPEDSTITRIVGAKLTTSDKEGKVIGESDLDENGWVLSYKDSYYDRKFTLTKNGDVALVKATEIESGIESTYERAYLRFDKKGNWTEVVNVSDNQSDTIRRIICYSDKDVEKLFADKKSKNKLAAKEYLDLNYSDFAPWTVNEAGLTDSLATPFSELISASIQYALLSLDMVKANSIKEVNDISEKEKFQYSVLLEAATMCDNPEGPDKSRLGFKAIARRANSNTDETIYFFLNNDPEKTIGHCSLDLKKKIIAVEEAREKFMRDKRETLSYLR